MVVVIESPSAALVSIVKVWLPGRKGGSRATYPDATALPNRSRLAAEDVVGRQGELELVGEDRSVADAATVDVQLMRDDGVLGVLGTSDPLLDGGVAFDVAALDRRQDHEHRGANGHGAMVDAVWSHGSDDPSASADLPAVVGVGVRVRVL